MLEEIDPDTIPDPHLRQLFVRVLDLLETALHKNQLLQEENQRLRDEISRLKGQTGKPDLRPAAKDYSSKTKTKRPPKKDQAKPAKKARLEVTKTEKLLLDRKVLPKDAEFKGYEEVVV